MVSFKKMVKPGTQHNRRYIIDLVVGQIDIKIFNLENFRRLSCINKRKTSRMKVKTIPFKDSL